MLALLAQNEHGWCGHDFYYRPLGFKYIHKCACQQFNLLQVDAKGICYCAPPVVVTQKDRDTDLSIMLHINLSSDVRFSATVMLIHVHTVVYMIARSW